MFGTKKCPSLKIRVRLRSLQFVSTSEIHSKRPVRFSIEATTMIDKCFAGRRVHSHERFWAEEISVYTALFLLSAANLQRSRSVCTKRQRFGQPRWLVSMTKRPTVRQIILLAVETGTRACCRLVRPPVRLRTWQIWRARPLKSTQEYCASRYVSTKLSCIIRTGSDRP